MIAFEVFYAWIKRKFFILLILNIIYYVGTKKRHAITFCYLKMIDDEIHQKANRKNHQW